MARHVLMVFVGILGIGLGAPAYAQPDAPPDAPPDAQPDAPDAEAEAPAPEVGAEEGAAESVSGDGGETEAEAGAGEEADGESPADGAGGLGEAPPTPGLVVVVVDAAAYGIDPVVGEHVSRQMRETAAALGYDVVTREDTIAAAQRTEMPYPPTPSDLWRITFAAQAQRGAFARVWADSGQYVLELSVASADGTGPFFARGTTTAEALHESVDRLLREALPTPDTYDEEAARAIATSTPQQPQAQPTPETPVVRPTRPIVRPSRRNLAPSRRFDVALQTEAAFGVSEDRFYNHLAGLRFGVRITRTIALELSASYINLRGRGQRVHNILPMVHFENRFRISSRIDLTVPLRVGLGYLPFNGPVLRLAAGLNLPVSSRFEIGLDLLAPTFWFLLDQTLVSLNIGAELIYRL